MSINIQNYNKCYYSDSNEFNYNKKNINYYEDDVKIISVSSYDSIYINYKNSNSDKLSDKPNNSDKRSDKPNYSDKRSDKPNYSDKQSDKPNNSDKQFNEDKRNKYDPEYYNPKSGNFSTNWDYGQFHCSEVFKQSYNQSKLEKK
jgi:hypothetical protein